MGKNPRHSAALIAFILMSLALIHGPLIIADPLLARDDLHILSRLKSWDTLVELVRSGKPLRILAYQPVTELSLRLDLLASRTLGFGTFHLTNAMIWLAIVATVHRIADRIFGISPAVRFGVAVFAVHPVFVGSVAWVSARKHLLSSLFILLATSAWLGISSLKKRSVRQEVSVAALYSLSVLSHPINVLWPAWAAFHGWRRGSARASLRALAPCLALMALGAAANLAYYLTDYVSHTSRLKIVAGHAGLEASAAVSLLALGRYLSNFLLPFSLSAAYYPGSAWNAVGLVLATGLLICLLFLRRGGTWLLFALIPLVPVTAAMTNVFVSDTYVLVAGAGLLFLALELTQGRGRPKRKALSAGVLAAALLLPVALVGLSARQARSWTSDRALWEHAVETEPSPRSLAALARLLLNEAPPDHARAQKLIERLASWSPGDPDLPYLTARSIYVDPGLTGEQKATLLGEVGSSPQETVWAKYFLAATLASGGRFEEARIALADALRTAPRELRSELAGAAAELVYFCAKSPDPRCEQTISGLRSQNPDIWDQSLFIRRLSELTRE